MEGLLKNIRQNGFRPGAIIDVGAFVGDWSRLAAGIFPESQVYMFDGNPENEAALQAAQTQLGSRSHYKISLLGPEAGKETVFFLLPGGGSCVLPELTTFERRQIRVPMATLDEAAENVAIGVSLLPKFYLHEP